jgi:hypothetical protein
MHVPGYQNADAHVSHNALLMKEIL